MISLPVKAIGKLIFGSISNRVCSTTYVVTSPDVSNEIVPIPWIDRDDIAPATLNHMEQASRPVKTHRFVARLR